ncbi:MAG: lmo0937 family membrane protein [Actinomycetota bacterium]|nr:lmo0937 family membrane protein [Actinomycetota bacterium]
MLLAVAGVLLVLWALGFFAVHIAGGFIHIVVVLAVIAVVLHFVRGGRARV